jgi:rhodanese-related sulfurtransferase
MEMLNWPGGRNVRDLGGRQLTDGGTTRHGRVFRSGAPEYLTDEGWAKAKEAGVRTVIDLRNAPAETQRTPEHPVIRPESLHGLVFVNAPAEDPDDAEFLAVCGPYLDHPRAWRDNLTLAHNRIERVFQAIEEADGPVLIHCAGGRDRTGMICAMLLKAAGATEQAILDDYADGWRGAVAYRGHAWVYDIDEKRWKSQEKTPEDPAQKIDDRIPSSREWINLPDSLAERFGSLLR